MITGETEAIMRSHLYDDFIFGSKKKRLARKASRKNARITKRLTRKTSRKSARVTKRLARKTNKLEKRNLKRNTPSRVEKRQRRKNFLLDVGKGISQSIDLLKVPSDTSVNPLDESESDYEISIGDSEEPNKKPEKSGIPKLVYIAGGVVVVLIVGVIVIKKKQPTY